MPGRDIPLISDEIYHIFNKGIAGQPVFINKKNYQRFIETLIYYQNANLSVRFSKFLTLSIADRKKILENFNAKKKFIVDLISYCLMPNHFHLVLRQLKDNGISKFVGDLTNSYTRYFNESNKRKGPIFQGKFGAVRIEGEEQLLHLVRYIHLNPYTNYVLKKVSDLSHYPFSSLGEYLGIRNTNIVNTQIVLSNFENIKSFKTFTFDRADYQRQLQNIKHLLVED